MVCKTRKDNVDGHWWLQLGNTYLMGYWPSSLFSVLSNSASIYGYGWEVINRNIGGQRTATQMGSGHVAEEGPSRASFFQNLKVMDAEQILRGSRDNHGIITNRYNLLKGEDLFYYGGPGRRGEVEMRWDRLLEMEFGFALCSNLVRS